MAARRIATRFFDNSTLPIRDDNPAPIPLSFEGSGHGRRRASAKNAAARQRKG